MKNVLAMTLLSVCCLLMAVPAAGADEQKYELKAASATIRDILVEQGGKRVTLRLENGESVEGTVGRVGDSVVHVAKLSGRDFYDAVVRIDRISAVIFKVRGN